MPHILFIGSLLATTGLGVLAHVDRGALDLRRCISIREFIL